VPVGAGAGITPDRSELGGMLASSVPVLAVFTRYLQHRERSGRTPLVDPDIFTSCAGPLAIGAGRIKRRARRAAMVLAGAVPRHPGTIKPEKASHFLIGYTVLALSFVLEGLSFLRSVRQAKPEAESMQRDLIEHVLATSDPTLRAVFAEDSAALAGLVIAAPALPPTR
jgi:hypothetical protein